MIGAIASVPDLKKDSSDEDEDSISQPNGGPKANDIFRSISIDSGMSTVDFSLSPDPLDSAGIGSVNTAFNFDESLPSYSDILTKQIDAVR
ncbi:hypothetical protein KUTeg_023410 [Tegillarca granosa]|nr:hypothetical protein KUTeg_023410 [Tegillarca granosa]